jgi:hypothetical protein
MNSEKGMKFNFSDASRRAFRPFRDFPFPASARVMVDDLPIRRLRRGKAASWRSNERGKDEKKTNEKEEKREKKKL